MTFNVLAIETATEACSVALARGDDVAERHEIAGRRHTERVFPMIDAVLAEFSLTPADVDVVAFGCGPGSFTGVRIAASIAQGIAFAGGIPVAPVSTLLAIAAGGARRFDARRVACALDARRSEIYAAAYAFDPADAGVRIVVADCVLAPAALALPPPADWLAVGNGWEAYAAQFTPSAGAAHRVAFPHPHASDVARLGAAMHVAGTTVAAHEAQPVYLRRGVD